MQLSEWSVVTDREEGEVTCGCEQGEEDLYPSADTPRREELSREDL